MEQKSKVLLIRALKAFFLRTFSFVGMATPFEFFIFGNEQTGDKIIINLITGVGLSIVSILIFWEKWTEELTEEQIKSN